MPFCVTLAWRDKQDELVSHYFELAVDGSKEIIKEILKEQDQFVMHNAKFDVQKLILAELLDRAGVQSERIHDTECIVHLLDEQRRKGLKELARTILNEETDEDTEVAKARRKHKLKKSDAYHLLPREVIIPYALKDAEFTLRIFEKTYPLLQKHKDLSALYLREQQLMLILLDIEAQGMALDTEYLERVVKEYAMEILKLEFDIRDMVGEDFNPNSPKQVMEAFLAFDIPLEGTSKEILEQVEHPLGKMLLELRSLKKLHGTYLKPLLQEQKDGIIHPWFRQHGTKTGRMSSGDANNG